MFDIHFDVLNNLREIFESKKEINERIYKILLQKVKIISKKRELEHIK